MRWHAGLTRHVEARVVDLRRSIGIVRRPGLDEHRNHVEEIRNSTVASKPSGTAQ